MPRLTRIDGSAQLQLLSTLQVFLFPTTPKRRIFPSSFSRQHAEVLYDVVQAAYGTFGDQNRTHYRLLREKRGLSYLLLPICPQYRSDPPAPPLIYSKSHRYHVGTNPRVQNLCFERVPIRLITYSDKPSMRRQRERGLVLLVR